MNRQLDPPRSGAVVASVDHADGQSSRGGNGDRRPPKLSEYIARRIVGDIVREDMQPGDRLPAAAVMAERYRVGTASLREALRLLEMSGLVYLKTGPGGGPIVADRSGAQLSQTIRLYFQTMGVTFRDVINARRSLEPLLAREAALQASPELLTKLAQLAETDGDGDAESFSHNARGFHDLLARQVPSNPILGLFVRTTGDVYSEFVRTRGPQRVREDRPHVHEQHAGIADAIRNGECDRAEQLMDAHMAGLVEYVSAEYEMSLDDVIEWD